MKDQDQAVNQEDMKRHHHDMKVKLINYNEKNMIL